MHLKSTSTLFLKVIRLIFYGGEGNGISKEAVQDEEIPSELLELVKCTGTVHDADDVAIPAAFVHIDVEKAPAPEKLFVTIKLQAIGLKMSGGFRNLLQETIKSIK